jgi:hypothetical protein
MIKKNCLPYPIIDSPIMCSPFVTDMNNRSKWGIAPDDNFQWSKDNNFIFIIFLFSFHLFGICSYQISMQP